VVGESGPWEMEKGGQLSEGRNENRGIISTQGNQGVYNEGFLLKQSTEKHFSQAKGQRRFGGSSRPKKNPRAQDRRRKQGPATGRNLNHAANSENKARRNTAESPVMKENRKKIIVRRRFNSALREDHKEARVKERSQKADRRKPPGCPAN